MGRRRGWGKMAGLGSSQEFWRWDYGLRKILRREGVLGNTSSCFSSQGLHRIAEGQASRRIRGIFTPQTLHVRLCCGTVPPIIFLAPCVTDCTYAACSSIAQSLGSACLGILYTPIAILTSFSWGLWNYPTDIIP